MAKNTVIYDGIEVELNFAVCHDHQRRTCIQVVRDKPTLFVHYIPLDVENGLQVHTLSFRDFDSRFKPMVKYPVDKAARLYVGYAKDIGATKEALDFLGHVINITNQEYDMATTKKATNDKAVKAAKDKTPVKKAPAVKAKSKPAAKSIADIKKPGVGKKPSNLVKKNSASQMFKDLIMEGKLTDDQIFAQVQKEFGLDEKKRSYVKWYRNDLKKSGMNPPDAKV